MTKTKAENAEIGGTMTYSGQRMTVTKITKEPYYDAEIYFESPLRVTDELYVLRFTVRGLTKRAVSTFVVWPHVTLRDYRPPLDTDHRVP